MSDSSMISKLFFEYNNKKIQTSENDSIVDVFHKKIIEENSESIKELKFDSQNDVVDIMLTTPTQDDGGIIAMTGFYYQQLIALLYIFDIFDKKWDGIFLDHHQDIVVYNLEKKIIKFIQVKTKNKLVAKASESELYKSWIPKLFMTSQLFKDLLSSGYSFEYELVSNCNFEHNGINDFCVGKVSNSQKIIDNKFAQKIKENIKDDTVDFYGCMSNFTLQFISHIDIVGRLIVKATEIIEIGGILDDSILDYIIGWLFRHCYNVKSPSIQLIEGKQISNLYNTIEQKLTHELDQRYKQASVESNIVDGLSRIHEEYLDNDEVPSWIDEAIQYVKNILENFFSNEGITVRSFMDQFINKNANSFEFSYKDIESKSEELVCVLNLLVLMRIYYDSEIDVDKDGKRLLSIKIANLFVGLVSVSDNKKKIVDLIEEFKDFFKSLDNREKIGLSQKILSENLTWEVIFLGKFQKHRLGREDFFKKIRTEELEFSDKPDNIGGIEKLDDNLITKVTEDVIFNFIHRDSIDTVNSVSGDYNTSEELCEIIGEELHFDEC